MSTERIVGVTSVKIGKYQSTTKWMPSTFTTISNLVLDSVVIKRDDPEPAQFFTEDSDVVDVEIAQSASWSFEFATYDMMNTLFHLFLGGSVTNTTACSIWKAPTTATTTVEKSVQITSKTFAGNYHVFKIPHASIRVGGDLKFSKNAPGQLNISGTVLSAGTNPPITKTII